MAKEKTLDEALDEFDRWGEALSRKLQRMTPAQRVEYFAGSLERLRKSTGIDLKLKVVKAPKRVASKS